MAHGSLNTPLSLPLPRARTSTFVTLAAFHHIRAPFQQEEKPMGHESRTYHLQVCDRCGKKVEFDLQCGDQGYRIGWSHLHLSGYTPMEGDKTLLPGPPQSSRELCPECTGKIKAWYSEPKQQKLKIVKK
jgi:hypothetical protein